MVRVGGHGKQQSETKTRTRWLLALVLVVAGLTRVGWALNVASDVDRVTTNDTASYVDSSRALIEDWRFNERAGSDTPMYIRTPGYPAFLALSSMIVGESVRRLSAFQALVSLISVWLVFILARELFDDITGLVAATIASFEPLLFWSSGVLMTESLNGLLLLTAAVAFNVALRPPWGRPVQWIAPGLSLAAATMVRPTTYFLPLLIFPIVALIGRRRQVKVRTLILSIGAASLPILILVGGWQVRNHVQVDSWRLSGIEALNIYSYRAAGIAAEEAGRPLPEVRDEFLAHFGRPRSGEPVGPYYDQMYQTGLEIVIDHPLTLAIISARGFTSETFGVASTIFPYLGIGESPALLAVARTSVGLYWVLVLFGAAALLRTPGRQRAPALLSALVVVYVLAISAGPEAYSRFRAPVAPIMCVFAAGGVALLMRFVQRQRAKATPAVASLMPTGERSADASPP